MSNKNSAVLTRYTALRSFHLQTTGISPLDYSRALVHAKGLMESYIDYKNILKQIQIVIQDAAFGLIGLEQAQTQDIPKIASADQFSQSQNSSHTVPTEKATVVDTPGSGLPEISWKAYAATIPGLVQASRDCKALMIAIIKQVDDLTENPAAVDKQPNSSKVQDPALFRQLIPVSKPKAMGLPLKTGPMPVAQPITQTPGALTTATAAAPSGPTQSTPVPALRRQSPVQPVAPNEIVKQHTGEQMPATPALPSEQTATQQTEKVEEEPATQQATGEGQKPATSALPSEQPATQQTEEGEEVPATQQATVEDTPPSDS
ncbi:hypothetical protein MMC21_007942 [Puttea exsequens]|nr:hypothetical protein [Puttea exsequens]